jgi:uncharacterized OB-fold protein
MDLSAVDLSPALDVPVTAERRRHDGKTLVGSRCRACAAASFPARAVCHRCGAAALAGEPFARTGELITYTTVHVERPGLPAPYTLGQIRLDDAGPLVFGQVRGLPADPGTGPRVGVVIAPEGQMPRYWFEVLDHFDR